MQTGMETETLLVQLLVMSSLQIVVPLVGQVAGSLWLLYHQLKASTLDLQMQDNIWHGSDHSLKNLDSHKKIPLNCDVTIELQSFFLRIHNIVHDLSIFSANITIYEMTWLDMESALCSGIQQRTWWQISLPKLSLMTNTQSSVYLWDYGLGRVGVSGNEYSGPPRPPARDGDLYQSDGTIICRYITVCTCRFPSVFDPTLRETEGEYITYYDTSIYLSCTVLRLPRFFRYLI